MDYDNITRLTSTALLLCLLVSLPAVGVAAIAGLLISFLQAITSLQDSSISHGLEADHRIAGDRGGRAVGGAAILQFANSIMQTLFT